LNVGQVSAIRAAWVVSPGDTVTGTIWAAATEDIKTKPAAATENIKTEPTKNNQLLPALRIGTPPSEKGALETVAGLEEEKT
jgi:hypothetical protein